MAKYYNIIITPTEGGATQNHQINLFWLKIGLALAGVIFVGLAVIVVSWTSMAKRAADYDRLAAEKTQLEADTKRIIRIAREVELNKEALARVVRSLGGQVEVKDPAASSNLNVEGELWEGEVEASPFESDEMASPWDDSYSSLESLITQDFPIEMPVQGFISREFQDNLLFPELSHRGLDIAGQTGAPVRAAAEGRVVFADWTPYFGNCMIISHNQGYLTFYGHNLYNLKKISEIVKRGEPIALVGSTGQSSAPHLHFEIWKDGISMDPREFIGNNVTSKTNL